MFYFGDDLKASFIFLKTLVIIHIMTAQDWAGFILTVLSIGGILLGGLKWYIDIRVKPISEAVEDIRKETKTNGGSSMRDEIKQIKVEQEHAKEKRKAQSEKIDHMYDLFVEYLSKNNK
jgi:hypothetical protein